MTVGEKIRFYRTEKGLLQKELAIKSKISESAIRNYELGNRYPNQSQREAIAAALGISVFAISDPSFDNEHAIMHAFFELEKEHGLKTKQENGVSHIDFDSSVNRSMQQRITEWAKVAQQVKDGIISEEEYEEWKSTYPAGAVFNKK